MKSIIPAMCCITATLVACNLVPKKREIKTTHIHRHVHLTSKEKPTAAPIPTAIPSIVVIDGNVLQTEAPTPTPVSTPVVSPDPSTIVKLKSKE